MLFQKYIPGALLNKYVDGMAGNLHFFFPNSKKQNKYHGKKQNR